MIITISILFIPAVSRMPTDVTESVRLTAQVSSMMKNNYLVFFIMGYTIVFTFSLMVGVISKLIQIRLFNKNNMEK